MVIGPLKCSDVPYQHLVSSIMQQKNISSYLDTLLRGIIVVSTDASMLFEVLSTSARIQKTDRQNSHTVSAHRRKLKQRTENIAIVVHAVCRKAWTE